ncbi:MAG: thioredoxin family protein [Acidimicrobiales bacterium]
MYLFQPRVMVVLLVVFGLALAKRLYRRWRAGLLEPRQPQPRLPAELVRDAERTWVVFGTPLCANCGPASESLATFDPAARVVRVDATREPALARAFDVRAAPTALLADRDGQVSTRLVGAEAVSAYVRSPQ